MTTLSFNEYKNYKNISEVFTFSANMIIYSVFYSIFLSIIFMIVFVFIINLFKDFFINTFSDTSLIINIFVLFIFYIFAFTPFIIYNIYKKDMKYKNISIYFSRIMMYISLYNIVKYLFTMTMPYNSPYDIRINFILYNVAITIGAVNLFFVRIDYKASIFTKIVYIIFPVITFIFNIIIFSSLLYRIKEYGISPNKLTLIFTNMIILVYFILTIIDNIKSLKKLGTIKNIKSIILTNNRSCYVYVYGIIAFIICFIMPLFYS
ncbi:hypothetical protein [Brachyspira innocens]|uniref:hypothetical protein n=1 Tax=Brachyspira innocens TaxID=13264 RepID=UPI0026EA9BB7|nr:hypothetical protein [Brachyspira innocens]